jgi:UDPglucose 6-dehydrogenase
MAGELGAGQAFALLREVDSINMRRRNKMVELARAAAGGSFVGSRVAVLGAAFKPDSDDVRDSPALNIAGQIQLQGAAVSVYDPEAMQNARQLFPTLNYATDVHSACTGADVVMILTEWKHFVSISPSELAQTVRRHNVIDGRNCLDPALWRAAGWTYRGIGRP